MSQLERELIDAGFKKQDANNYQHEKRGLFYRDQRSGRWYLKESGKAARFMGRTLREGIMSVLEVGNGK